MIGNSDFEVNSTLVAAIFLSINLLIFGVATGLSYSYHGGKEVMRTMKELKRAESDLRDKERCLDVAAEKYNNICSKREGAWRENRCNAIEIIEAMRRLADTYKEGNLRGRKQFINFGDPPEIELPGDLKEGIDWRNLPRLTSQKEI